MSKPNTDAPERELEMMWQALKKRCCVVPDEAVRVVMLSEEKFKDAMAPFAFDLARASLAPAGEGEAAQVAFRIAKEFVAKSLAPKKQLIHEPNDYWQRAKGAEAVYEALTGRTFTASEVAAIDHKVHAPDKGEVARRIIAVLRREVGSEAMDWTNYTDNELASIIEAELKEIK